MCVFHVVPKVRIDAWSWQRSRAQMSHLQTGRYQVHKLVDNVLLEY